MDSSADPLTHRYQNTEEPDQRRDGRQYPEKSVDSSLCQKGVSHAPWNGSHPCVAPISAPQTQENLCQSISTNGVADTFAVDLVRLLANHLVHLTSSQNQRQMVEYLKQQMGNIRDPSFWRAISMQVKTGTKQQKAFLQRRLEGNYKTDPYGMDWEVIELMSPLLSFLYHQWWRVQVEGIEHIPATGAALLVANHSGVLPWDGAMITAAVSFEHPERRFVRSLFHDWFSTTPFIGSLFVSLGQAPGIPENAIRLLQEEEVVCTFPEGLKGIGKPFRERYRLARFGRGGFVQIALRTGAPLIPVAIVGAEEIYPLIGDAKGIARLIGFPYFPITPFFPWLGVLGMIPLPSRWSITFCPPIPTADYGPAAADDPLTVFALADQVRNTIQQTINAKLAARTSVF